MSFTRIAALAVLAASLSVGSGHAQSLRNAQTPAEFPPASFNGTQYVDSRGCVFIRAGIDGNVTWVPRVNRQRQVICGQTPSLSANAAAAARATPQQTARGTPEQITITPPARPTATADAAPAPAPAPAPRPTVRTTRPAATTAPAPEPAPSVVVRRPTPAPAPVVRRVSPPPAPARPTIVQTAPRPAPAPARTVTAQRAAPSCQGASPISSRYINSGQHGPVRCGPQPVSRSAPARQPVTTAQRIQVPQTRTITVAPQRSAAVGPNTRVVPRHVYENRTLQRPSRVPEGFVPVWKDDRLNPRRAEQSLNGIAQTRLRWTTTVPRRLIDRSTGRDVTATVPLVYPYTDIATQERDLGTVTLVRRNGQLMKRVQRKSSATARQPVVSTRSAPAPVVKAPTRTAPKPAPAAQSQAKSSAGRYVQVGTFGVPSNAQAAAQRIARAGMPARIGRVTRGGKSYQVVLAGPFASSADLSRGLQRSRAAGFSDAFVRK